MSPDIFMVVKWLSPVLAGLMLAVVVTPCGYSQHDLAPTAIVLHVDITNQTVSLNGSGSEQAVSLSGVVRVDYVLLSIRVVLSSSTDLSWPANVTPKEMTFNTSASQNFNVEVDIPADTYNRTATLTVKGNATITITGLPADTSSDTATIVVNGPGEGTQPEIPSVPPPKGGGASVLIPNLPVITAVVSAVVVASTAVVFWKWKSRQLKKDGATTKKRMNR
jgi:hypothetical protein